MIYHLKKDMTGFNQFGKPIGYRSASAAGLLASKMPSDGLVFYNSLKSAAGLNVTGSPQFVTHNGIPCAYFDGDSYFSTTASNLPQGQSERTLSCWFNYDDDCYLGDWVFMLGYGTFDYYSEFILGISDSGRAVAAGYGRDAIFSFYPDSETFYHMAVTFYDGEANLYIDGEFIQTVHVSGLDTTGNDIWIGSQYDNCLFKGYIAAPRIYNRILTAEEIQQLSTEFTI